MPKVVSIRFHGAGKAYHFDPVDFKLHQGDAVIVETVQGIELGIVADEITEIPQDKLAAPLKPVLRPADDNDLAHYEDNRAKEAEAYKIASEKIELRELDMHLVDVEYTFDNRKIIFYFTADGRVDFRELVKDLAAIFRIRIELRQIGVRDEARKIGGVGICGRELCCCSFLNDFVPVSIKMAKEQSLSMNPVKISGICGRLMCCLKYEQDAYEDARSRMPRQGWQVDTPEGPGVVDSINLLKETVTVRLDRGGENDVIVFANEDVEVTGNKHARKCPPGGCPGHAARDKTRQPAPRLEENADKTMWPRLDSDGNVLESDEAAQDNLFRMEESAQVQQEATESPAVNQTQSDKASESDSVRNQRQNTAAGNNNRNRGNNQRRGSQQRSDRNRGRSPRGPGDNNNSSVRVKPEDENRNRPAGSRKNRGRRRPIRKPGEAGNSDGGAGRPVERKD